MNKWLYDLINEYIKIFAEFNSGVNTIYKKQLAKRIVYLKELIVQYSNC